jgi:hypothetical protein
MTFKRAEHNDGPRWECPGCIEQDHLMAKMLSRAGDIIRMRDEVAADRAFDTCPDYACGRPDPDAIALAEIVLMRFAP